jgi:hypothetical protein
MASAINYFVSAYIASKLLVHEPSALIRIAVLNPSPDASNLLPLDRDHDD